MTRLPIIVAIPLRSCGVLPLWPSPRGVKCTSLMCLQFHPHPSKLDRSKAHSSLWRQKSVWYRILLIEFLQNVVKYSTACVNTKTNVSFLAYLNIGFYTLLLPNYAIACPIKRDFRREWKLYTYFHFYVHVYCTFFN